MVLDGDMQARAAFGWWESSFVNGKVHLLRAGRLANLRPTRNGTVRLDRVVRIGHVLCQSLIVTASRMPTLEEYNNSACEECVTRTAEFAIDWPAFIDRSETGESE